MGFEQKSNQRIPETEIGAVSERVYLLVGREKGVARFGITSFFVQCEEFERTGQLRKIHVKQRGNFTIDVDLMRQFRQYCQEKGYKMSTVVEQLLKQHIQS
jgi:hypothetical protein